MGFFQEDRWDSFPGVETPPGFCPREAAAPEGCRPGNEPVKRETSSHQFQGNQGVKPRSQTPWSIQVRGALPIDPAMDTRRQRGAGTPETWVPLSDLRRAGEDASV